MIEDKYYTELSTEKEVQAMKERIWLEGDDMIFLHEYPRQTPFSVDVAFDRIEELAKSIGEFALIVNLCDAHKPDALARKQIKERYRILKGDLIHSSCYTGDNILINTVIRFVMHGYDIKSLSVHKSQEDAINRARQELDG